MTSINLIGVGLIAFFIAFILRKPRKVLSDYFLVLLNGMLAAILLADIWVKKDLTAISFVFQTLASFYIFPSFFLYGMLLMEKEQRIKPSWLWSGSVAAGLTVFLFLDFVVFHSYEAADIQRLYEDPPLVYHIFYKGHRFFMIGILIWFWRKLNAHQDQIKDQFSFIEPIRLQWLRNFTVVYALINAITFIGFPIYNLGIIESIDTVFLVLNVFLVLCLFYLSFNGIRQYAMAEFQEKYSQPISPLSIEEKTTPAETPISPPPDKYRTSSLAERDMEQLYETIIPLFEEEKVYLEPQLQIQDIANRLGVTTHKVSQTINSLANKPFYDLVNGYRVDHLKQLLSLPENKQYTILALGLESGFNSKASLNRIFKQQTGLSPREFQKSQLLG